MEPFVAVAAVIVLGGLADRVGAFRLLARLLIPERASPRLTFAGVLGITAMISAITNLDVAVVVAMPVALRVASTRCISPGGLAIAVALTANVTSFLLSTSNVTTLLILSRAPVSVATYLGDAWAAWALVTAMTVSALTLVLGRDPGPQPRVSVPHSAWLPAIGDLAPMFVIASAVRALLGSGIAVQGGFWMQAAVGERPRRWTQQSARGVRGPPRRQHRALGQHLCHGDRAESVLDRFGGVTDLPSHGASEWCSIQREDLLTGRCELRAVATPGGLRRPSCDGGHLACGVEIR